MSKETTVFERYPQLRNLRGLVPDKIVEREIAQNTARFELYRKRAQTRIPTASLRDLFPASLASGRIVLENFLGQSANTSLEELCQICLIARYLQPQAIFEFGTYNGCTTLQLAMNTPDTCTMYTLNLPPEKARRMVFDIGEVEQGHVLSSFNFDVGSYFKGTPFQKRIVQLWGDSAVFDFSAFHNRMDLVFVDATHTYDYVKADTENAFRMVRPGSVIIWHDYMQVLHPDVTHYLYEISPHRPIYHLQGTNLAVHYQGKK